MEVGAASYRATFPSSLGRSRVAMGSGTAVPGGRRAGMLCWQHVMGGCSEVLKQWLISTAKGSGLSSPEQLPADHPCSLATRHCCSRCHSHPCQPQPPRWHSPVLCKEGAGLSRCFPSLPAISAELCCLWWAPCGHSQLGQVPAASDQGHTRAGHRNVPRRAEGPSAPTWGEILTWGHTWDGKHSPSLREYLTWNKSLITLISYH